jgi:hypothetical protein
MNQPGLKTGPFMEGLGLPLRQLDIPQKSLNKFCGCSQSQLAEAQFN